MKKESEAKSTVVEPRELFDVVREASDEFFKKADAFAPRYVEAMTTLRREYVKAARETVNVALDVQESLYRRAGVTPKVSRHIEDSMRAGADALISAQDDLLHASLSVTQELVKGAGAGTKAATGLMRTAADFWLSFLKQNSSVKAA
jgi:hypothetical protein